MKRMNKASKYGAPTKEWLALSATEQEVMIARSEELMLMNEEMARLVSDQDSTPVEVIKSMVDYSKNRVNELMKSVGVDPEEFRDARRS